MDALVVHTIAEFVGPDEYQKLVRINRIFAKIVQKLIHQNVEIDLNDWKKGYQKVRISNNQPVILLDGLRTVTFGYWFNQPVILPEGLQTVTFSCFFNQPVILPKSLQTVTFGLDFNQPVILPEGLLTVTFGGRFNQPVIFPEGLQTVTFGC